MGGRAHFGGMAAWRHGRTIVRPARREMLLITTAIVFDRAAVIEHNRAA
jgi:hypothetical protein